MANLTLSIQDRLLERAREVAASQGTSLNGLVRGFLESIAAEPPAGDQADELRRLFLSSCGDSKGWRFNRDELHER
jgi:hypothetical protein